MKIRTESGLSESIKNGDVKAFKQLYEESHEDLYYFAKKYIPDNQLCEDAVQEIFVKLWQKRSTIDTDKSIRGFLFTCMKNHLLNQIRSNKRRIVEACEMNEFMHPSEHTTGIDISLNEYRSILQHGIEQLPEKKRRIFKMKIYDGLCNAQISEKLSISVNTVKVHFYHSRLHVRKYLKQHADLEVA